jgi:hypothetical protein
MTGRSLLLQKLEFLLRPHSVIKNVKTVIINDFSGNKKRKKGTYLWNVGKGKIKSCFA